MKCMQNLRNNCIILQNYVWLHRTGSDRHIWWHMNTPSNGNIFRVTGPLWGEFTGHRWTHLTKSSDAELWRFLWSVPEQTVEQTIERLVTWDAIPDNKDHGANMAPTWVLSDPGRPQVGPMNLAIWDDIEGCNRCLVLDWGKIPQITLKEPFIFTRKLSFEKMKHHKNIIRFFAKNAPTHCWWRVKKKHICSVDSQIHDYWPSCMNDTVL